MLSGIHHIQLAMPEGLEDQARAFYGRLLGLSEVEKPAPLAARGGVWFAQGSLRVHLGIETPFHPATKAHPAFMVEQIDTLSDRLASAGVDVRWDTDLTGYRRFYAPDPFGNRIEFLAQDV